MPELRGRRLELSVDTIKVSPALRVSGKGVKSYKQDPNSLELVIYNLNPEHRAQLTAKKSPIVKLAAGYGTGSDGLTQLFYGTCIYVRHEYDDLGNIQTTVSTTDGGEKKTTARVNLAFNKNTKTGDVLRRVAAATGLKQGNVDKIAKDLMSGLRAEIFLEGGAVSGSACDELGHLLRSCGYEYSIQDETIQIRKFGQAADGFAIELNPGSGLVGSPSLTNKGVCTGTALLFKAGSGLDMVPGRRINVTSAFVKGQFILAKVNYDFDTDADNWYCHFEAVAKKGDLLK